MAGGERRLVDGYGRVARKLRISVTDRCNFRCFFCMPEKPDWMGRGKVLTYEEIERLVRIFVGLGVSRVRLTGGEPLVRREIEKLVKMIRGVEGIERLGLTTNGYYLEEKAGALAAHGLRAVTVSLHSLKAERFEAVVKREGIFERVMRGIERAKQEGLRVKINCVVTRGCNEDEILEFARMAYQGGVSVRFIEYMPFDGENQWNMEKVVSGEEILQEIGRGYRLEAMEREAGSTAQVYRLEGSKGEIGVITSMTAPFCGDCDRVRLKADGKIVPCMFSADEYEVREKLRAGASDEELREYIREVFGKKSAGVEAMLRSRQVVSHIRPMHTIGG